MSASYSTEHVHTVGDVEHRYSTSTLVTQDKINLYTETWRPKNREPLGTITLVHGFGEHLGRWRHVIVFLLDSGFIVNGLDHRGHGQSAGKKAHTPSLSHMVDDIFLLAQKADPNLPHFVYGHSMGGGLSLLLAARKPELSVTGFIITDPLIKLSMEVPKATVTAAKMLAAIRPTTMLYNEIKPHALSTDQEVGKEYEQDPYVHRKISASLGAAFLKLSSKIYKEAPSIKKPILLVHGTEDQITSCEATKDVFALIESSDKTLKLFEGWYHEPHNEAEKDELFALLRGWLENHLPRRE
eukprot:TRINITY_DN15688_c0_g1_i1.p1 TRINITY_DN15688_c0_g1~~TRINITY_DN15688_c0_g1_i1.p1  ORF type:complete len:298 (-),score=49.92 TRINITY_DN15688_c0_g1_i1:52-945(-)